MKIAIVLNAKRVPDALKTQLKSDELSNKYNITYDLYLCEPQELETLLPTLNHKSYNAFLIGGGDGTVRTAIQVLAPHDIPIAILALGTFNFMAKKLEYSTDIDAIFAMIKNNKTKRIDLAEVNGHVITNHTWIGFYVYLLKLREKHKELLGRSKLLKFMFNALNLFRLIPIYDLTFELDQQTRHYQACLVYIGNNESYTNIVDFGEQKSLTSGLLSVIILKCKTRWQLFFCMCSILFNRFEKSKYVSQFKIDNLTITAKSPLINLVIDGELFKIETPLKFTIHPKKLLVMVP